MLSLSAYVITLNEARFIAQCLACLTSLTRDVVVVDSGSEDGTESIVRRFPGVRFIQRAMPPTFAAQRNFAASLCRGEWIITLDADELLHPELHRLVPALIADERHTAYAFPRLLLFPDEGHYIDKGRLISGDIDPQVRLYRRGQQWGHPDGGGLHERLTLNDTSLDARPSALPRVPRYVHYPILHYQLLKSDEELRDKAPAFLERQSNDCPIQISGQDWWVTHKRRQYPIRALEECQLWMGPQSAGFDVPPWNPKALRHWLQNEEARVDEIVAYTGRSHRQVNSVLERISDPIAWSQGRWERSGHWLRESFRQWQTVCCLPWLLRRRQRLRIADVPFSAGDAPVRRKRIAFVADGAELAMELFWMESHTWQEEGHRLICTGVEGPLLEFTRWRVSRLGLQRHIAVTSLDALKQRVDLMVISPIAATNLSVFPDVAETIADKANQIFCLGGAGGNEDSALAWWRDLAQRRGWSRLTERHWQVSLPLKRGRSSRTALNRRLLASANELERWHSLAGKRCAIDILPDRQSVAALPSLTQRFPKLTFLAARLQFDRSELTAETINLLVHSASSWDAAIVQNEDDLRLFGKTDIPLVFAPQSMPASALMVTVFHALRSRVCGAIFLNDNQRVAWGFAEKEAIVAPLAVMPTLTGPVAGRRRQCLTAVSSADLSDPLAFQHRLAQLTKGFPCLWWDEEVFGYGSLARERRRRLFQRQRVYVHVAQEAGIHSLLEAMSAGMPVVIWRNGELPIETENGVNAFESEDLGYVRSAIQQLLEDDELAGKIGKGGNALVHAAYNLKSRANQWANFVSAMFSA